MLEANPLLSITIPTYNRAIFLDRCLELLIEAVADFNIQIFISDNASTDNTKSIVDKRKKEYPFICYSKNESNVGYDKNFERALMLPDTEYTWLLGDTYHITEDALTYVLDLITVKKYDALVINVANRVQDIDEREYNDHNLLLSELGWHMTCLSSLLYHKEIILSTKIDKYQGSYFLQTGLMLEFLARGPFSLYWVKDRTVLPVEIEGIEKKSWHHETFEVWAVKWPNFIFSLPKGYELKTKLKCIMDHGHKSGLFSKRTLLRLRRREILSYSTYRNYEYALPLVVKFNKLFVMVISLVPQTLLIVAAEFLGMFKRLFRK